MSNETGDLPLGDCPEGLNWFPLCKPGQVPDESPIFTSAGGVDLMIVRQGARITVFNDRCPHIGASMMGARVEDGCIECPLHGASFDASSGTVLDGPTTQDLVCHPMRIRSDLIEVGFPPPESSG